MVRMESYVRTAADSSRRSRIVLSAIVVVSTILLVGFWNSWTVNYPSREVQLVEDTLRWVPFTEIPPNLTRTERERFEEARSFYKSREYQLQTEEDIKEHLKMLVSIQQEHLLTLRVPLLGVAFSVKDLSLVGGFVFAVLLLMFRFALARELANIRLTFREAEHRNQLPECFDLLLMEQVILFSANEARDIKAFWKRVPLILFILPAIIQIIVLIYYVNTVFINRDVRSVSLVELVLNLFFFFSVVILTWLCGTILKEMWHEWNKANKKCDQIHNGRSLLSTVDPIAGNIIQGVWLYKVVRADGNYLHAGYCIIERTRHNELKIYGLRKLTIEIENGSEQLRSVDNYNWVSNWTALGADNILRFEYIINVDGPSVRGFCWLKIRSPEIPEHQLAGGYYFLPPYTTESPSYHGDIFFTRPPEGTSIEDFDYKGFLQKHPSDPSIANLY